MTWRTWRSAGVGLVALALCAACTDDAGTRAAQSGSAPVAASGSAAPSACSLGSLSGRYLYEIHGNARFPAGLYPFLEVGEEVFDGSGHVRNTHTDSVARSDASTTGTYTLDASCRGTATYADGRVLRLLVSPGGEEYTTLDGDPATPDADLDGGADRVAGAGGASCSPDSLRGTYSYRARGFYDRTLHVEQGFETYDGGRSVTNAYVLAGSPDQHHLTGSYDVTGDCRAHVTYDGGPTFTEYLSPDGSDFLWIQVAGFAADDAAGLFGGREHRVSTSTDPALTRVGS